MYNKQNQTKINLIALQPGSWWLTPWDNTVWDNAACPPMQGAVMRCTHCPNLSEVLFWERQCSCAQVLCFIQARLSPPVQLWSFTLIYRVYWMIHHIIARNPLGAPLSEGGGGREALKLPVCQTLPCVHSWYWVYSAWCWVYSAVNVLLRHLLVTLSATEDFPLHFIHH